MLEHNMINNNLELIDRLHSQKENIIQKIKGLNNEICPICLTNFTNPIISKCCNGLYCFHCFTQMSLQNKSCALCRGEIDPRNVFLFSNKEIFKNTDVNKDKYQNLINFVKRKKEKILIYVDTFSKISNLLSDNGISHKELKGNYLEDFANGNIRVLLINNKHLGTGLNLQMAETLIIFHSIEEIKFKQLLSKIQKLGRTSSLDIHFLLYEYEHMYSDILQNKLEK